MLIPLFDCLLSVCFSSILVFSILDLSIYLLNICRTKNVPRHILAPAAVARNIFSIHRSAHPAGGFLYNRKCNFLLYKNSSVPTLPILTILSKIRSIFYLECLSVYIFFASATNTDSANINNNAVTTIFTLPVSIPPT